MISWKTTISVNYTADDWQLYDLPGRDEAAQLVNKAISDSFNSGSNSHAVWKAAWTEMTKHSNLGMIDSEGCRLLDSIMNKLIHPEYD